MQNYDLANHLNEVHFYILLTLILYIIFQKIFSSTFLFMGPLYYCLAFVTLGSVVLILAPAPTTQLMRPNSPWLPQSPREQLQAAAGSALLETATTIASLLAKEWPRKMPAMEAARKVARLPRRGWGRYHLQQWSQCAPLRIAYYEGQRGRRGSRAERKALSSLQKQGTERNGQKMKKERKPETLVDTWVLRSAGEDKREDTPRTANENSPNRCCERDRQAPQAERVGWGCCQFPPVATEGLWGWRIMCLSRGGWNRRGPGGEGTWWHSQVLNSNKPIESVL